MRPDMHKVVVERPRAGGGPGKQNRRANLPPELLPRSEGIRRPYRARKHFTDLLGPLRRWLAAQVGRRWDDVYSEACAVIRPDSVVRAHVKTHLLEFVIRHTFRHQGEVWCHGRRRFTGGDYPITEAGSRWTPFYVEPETGILRRIPGPILSPPHRRQPPAPVPPDCLWLSDHRALVCTDGLWFECVMEPFPRVFRRGDSPLRLDRNFRRLITPAEGDARYGRRAYSPHRRQLSRAELRRHGLANHPLMPGEENPRGPPEWTSHGQFFPRTILGGAG